MDGVIDRHNTDYGVGRKKCAVPQNATFGCYDMSTHQCSCPPVVTESSCVGLWTDQCMSCVAPLKPNGSENTPSSTQGTVATFGCYHQATHQCSCPPAIRESTCSGMWTDQCASCAAASQNTD